MHQPSSGPVRYSRSGWITPALLVVLVSSVATLNTHGGAGLSIVQDDFFYYSKIAQNVVAGHGSTFNGLVPTNGYHPLWMVCQIVIQYLVHSMSAILKMVEALAALSALAAFWIAQRTMQRFDVAQPMAVFLALLIAWAAWILGTSGMEIILTIPLCMALVLYVFRLPEDLSPKQALGFGLLSAPTILSRLDAVLLVLLLCVALLLQEPVRKQMTGGIVGAFLLGLLPFFFYLAINLHFFHVLLPISGSAKQLRLSHGITFTALEYIPHNRLGAVALLLDLFGLAGLGLYWKRLPANTRSLAMGTLLFPFLHFAVISQASDWPVWPWYFYSAIVPLPLAGFVLFHAFPLRSRSFQLLNAGSIAVLFLMLAFGTKTFIKHLLHRTPGAVPGVQIAMLVKIFSQTHPGIYAMGDRSGIVGQEMSEPLVQTEGLVMDKTFLNHIRKQDSLLDVLHQYNVRYYIASIPASQGLPHCLSVVEPAQGGPTVPKMRAILCADPIATYPGLQYNTVIYDLSKIH